MNSKVIAFNIIFYITDWPFYRNPHWKPSGAIQYRKLEMKLNFLILEVFSAQKSLEISLEEIKNWKQPTYWEAMSQVGFQSDIA